MAQKSVNCTALLGFYLFSESQAKFDRNNSIHFTSQFKHNLT